MPLLTNSGFTPPKRLFRVTCRIVSLVAGVRNKSCQPDLRPSVRTLAVLHNRVPLFRHTRSKVWPWQNAAVHTVPFNPRPTKGGGYHPPYGLSPAAQKRKRKWPRASRTSLLHPLRSFWWKKTGGTPEDGGRVSRQSSKVRGVVATSKYFKSPFWKISAWYGAKTFRTC